MAPKRNLTDNEIETLLETFRKRFSLHPERHSGISWDAVQAKLENNPKKLWSLSELERTGGEPDVVQYLKDTNEYVFFDCATESPSGRRSLCYDKKA